MELFHRCVTDLDTQSSVRAVVSRIRELAYSDRLDLLQKKSSLTGHTLLTKLATVMGSESEGKERPTVQHQAGYVNSMELLLSVVDHEDRGRLLRIGNARTNATALHVACEYGDTGTVTCILESLRYAQERLDLLLINAALSGHSIHTPILSLELENRIQLNPVLMAALNKGDDLSCLICLIRIIRSTRTSGEASSVIIMACFDCDLVTHWHCFFYK